MVARVSVAVKNSIYTFKLVMIEWQTFMLNNESPIEQFRMSQLGVMEVSHQ